MKTGIILIGDELLTGKRQDKHLSRVIEILTQRRMVLSWARIVGDDLERLTQTFRETFALGDLVFSFGGIGATPDDLTRQASAAAVEVNLVRHQEAAQLIEGRFGRDAYPNRIRMADLPEGAQIIPNPINRIPGFSLNHHHFVPGFPKMAWPMVEWVLDTHYRHLFNPEPIREVGLLITGTPESELIPLMEEFQRLFPQLRLSSLPSAENHLQIDLGVRGTSSEVERGQIWLRDQLNRRGIPSTAAR